MTRPDTGITPIYNKQASSRYYHKMKDDPAFKAKVKVRNEIIKAKLQIKRDEQKAERLAKAETSKEELKV